MTEAIKDIHHMYPSFDKDGALHDISAAVRLRFQVPRNDMTTISLRRLKACVDISLWGKSNSTEYPCDDEHCFVDYEIHTSIDRALAFVNGFREVEDEHASNVRIAKLELLRNNSWKRWWCAEWYDPSTLYSFRKFDTDDSLI